MTMLIALALFAAQTDRPQPIYVPEGEAVRTMHEFAGCVVRERGGEARAVLAMDFRTAAYQRRLRTLATANNRCLGRPVMRVSNLIFAGGLAEQLFLRSHATADPAALAAVPLETRDRTEMLTHCVVRRSPTQARAVLDTAPTSPEEAAALGALRPAIAACLDGADEAQFNRTGLRSLVALALYRRAEQAVRASGGGGS